VTLTFELRVNACQGPALGLCYCVLSLVRVDSSSSFPFRVQKYIPVHTQNQTLLITIRCIHRHRRRG